MLQGRTPFGSNPAVYLYDTYNNVTNNLISDLTLSYNILPGLDIRSNFGYTKTDTKDYAPVPSTAIRPDYSSFISANASYGTKNLSSWIVEPQITYNKSFGKSRINALLGTTFLDDTKTGNYLFGQGYSSDQLLHSPLAASSLTVDNYFNNEYKYNAFFGRINYNLDNSLIIDLKCQARRKLSFRASKPVPQFWFCRGCLYFFQRTFFFEPKID